MTPHSIPLVDPVAASAAGDEAMRRWLERGARLDANIQRNMRRVMSVVAAALGLLVIWSFVR